MKVIWALLCETTITDRDTNNVSLINVVDEITVPASPPQEPTEADSEEIALLGVGLRMVILCVRSNPEIPESGEMRIKVVAPDETARISVQLEVDLTQSQRLRGTGHLLEVPFLSWQEGQYLFKIETKTEGLDWQEMFELPLWVKVQTDDFPYDPDPQTTISGDRS